jgi:hypothetical protein
MSSYHPSFAAMLDKTDIIMRDLSHEVHTETWQGIDIKKKPEAKMRECVGYYFRVPMTVCNSPSALAELSEQLRPNLPWADQHFEERVCGKPINPGETWKRWPWANSASEFRDKKGRFEISYMERYWCGGAFEDTPAEGDLLSRLTGIRGRPYGDLEDIIELLIKEPYTRQAYLPVFFPEDTGSGGRVPCSLGYHWMMRSNYLHVHYPIRSCDYYRHFRDDVYLTVRLTMWLRDQLIRRAPEVWSQVQLGMFSMWIGSLHVFVNDYRLLFQDNLVRRR